MKNQLVLLLLVLTCAGCGAAKIDWSEFNPRQATPDSNGIACQLMKASECAYEVEKYISTEGNLGAGFCSTLKTATTPPPYGVRGPTRINTDDGNNKSLDTGFIALLPDRNVVMAFRGTLSIVTNDPTELDLALRDWVNDAKAKLVQDPDFGVVVHEGFLSSFNNTGPRLIDKLKQWIATDQLKEPFNLYVTGHSKGGAVATIAALKLRLAKIPVTGVYTFAAARAGGDDFVAKYSSQPIPIPTWRFENQGDIVPHLPPNRLELDTFHKLPHPLLENLEGGGKYTSLGPLQYITDDLSLIAVDPINPALEETRLKLFREKLSDLVSHERLLRALAENHSIGSPATGDHTINNRYYRAVCGSGH